MGPRNLNKESLLAESAYAQYSLRVHRHLPKGVLTLFEAKCTNDIKVLFSRHYGVVFFTDDYTFAHRTLSDFGRQSTGLPYKVGAVHSSKQGNVKVKPEMVIESHEAFLKEFFNEFRLIESLDDLITVLSEV